MKKKYLLRGFAIVAFFIIIILLIIFILSPSGLKGVHHRMANPENRRNIYAAAERLNHDTGINLPEYQIREHKAGEYHDNGLFRDTLIIFFHKGLPESAFESFETRAQVINNSNDTCKHVDIDGTTYSYHDFYVGGYSSYVSVTICRHSQYGRIIYGNWRPARP